MTKQKKSKELRLRNGLVSFARIHFVLILALVAQTILYDTSQLITPEDVLKRWIVISGLLAVNGTIWYLATTRAGHVVLYKMLAVLMILADIGLASFSVYSQRGMASRAVFLFMIPIIVSGLLLSRSALYATALVCIATYSLTAVSYFVLNFNEGYKVELYGEVGFYCFAMLLVAGFLAGLLKYRE